MKTLRGLLHGLFHPTPPITEPIGATAAHEPIWSIAFPVYFGYTLFYGLFAAFKPIVSLVSAGKGAPGVPDAAGAQTFGLLVVLASAAGLLGSIYTVRHRRDGWELIGDTFFTAMMLIYFSALTVLIAMHDPTTRPGSSFVPLGFGWFPFVRAVVIVRDRRKRRGEAAA